MAERKLIPAISADTITIISILRDTLSDPKMLVTKEDLRKAIGRDPTGLMATALRHLLRDHGMTVEYERLKGGWCNMVGGDNLRHRKAGVSCMRRKARREGEKLATIDFGKLTDPEKIETAAVASICGVVAHFAGTSSMKRIGGAIQKADAAGLPLGKTLSLFHDSGSNGKS